jgi:two-component system phosphate regulon response regulator PhoB
MMKPRVMIVEDEAPLVTLLRYNLEKEGFEVSEAGDGEEALVQIAERKPDVVLLDWMLPLVSGIEVCRQLRRAPQSRTLPIIMLTARGEESERVRGLATGADDYIVKPFSVRELLLRIRAVLRRAHRSESEAEVLRFGRLKVDREAHRAWVDDDELGLTALEFRLLYAFLSRKGRVQTRDALLSDVWGIDADVTTRTVDTHVKRLREKLGDAGDYIETLRGVGYRFRDQPDEALA